MEDRCVIEIKKTTRERLQKKRIAKRESYDEVINRVIDETETEKMGTT